MPIVRIYKRDRFVVIGKACLEDAALSFKAKGLHSYLMTLPDDWVVRMSDLEQRSTDGRLAVRSGMAELMEAGYVSRHPARTPDGQLDGVEYTVYETKDANPTVRQVSGLTVNQPDGKVVATEEPCILNKKNTEEKSIARGKPALGPAASFPREFVAKFLKAYEKATGGRMPWGRVQKALNMISDLNPDEALRGFEFYLSQQEDPMFISVEAFVRKAGMWMDRSRPMPTPRAFMASQDFDAVLE